MSWHERYIPETQGEWRGKDSGGVVVMQLETALVPLDQKPKRKRQCTFIENPQEGYEVRRCEYCEQPMKRKRRFYAWGNQLEPPHRYLTRRFCNRDCRGQFRRINSERARVQAMYWHFGLSKQDIQRITGWHRDSVYRAVICPLATDVPWWQRKNKEEAIEAARKLLGGNHAQL